MLEKPSANAQDIAALIKLLGGVPGCFDAKADLVLYDDTTVSAQLKKEIDRVKREARKLKRPAHPLTWLTDAIAKGETDKIVEELNMQLDSVRELYYNERASQMALSNLVREVQELREPDSIRRRIKSLQVASQLCSTRVEKRAGVGRAGSPPAPPARVAHL